MNTAPLKALALIAIPVATFLMGAAGMEYFAHRGFVEIGVREATDPSDRKPLNRRLFGYNAKQIERYWAQFDNGGLALEQRRLEIDLLFPFFYGASLLGPLIFAWISIKRPFAPIFVVAPVSITIIADWTENIIQLNLLRQFQSPEGQLVDSMWANVASIATSTKLTFFVGSALFLLVLVGKMVSSAHSTST
jgi:hypothetical protein